MRISFEYEIPLDTPYECLDTSIQNLLRNINDELTEYVVGAFYSDTNERFDKSPKGKCIKLYTWRRRMVYQ